jgi:serine protease
MGRLEVTRGRGTASPLRPRPRVVRVSDMKLARFKGGAASLVAVALSTVAAGAHAAPAGHEPPSPTLTGRALVSIDLRSSPTRRERSRELLLAVDRRHGLDVGGRSVAGGFLAVELGGDSVAELRERLGDDPAVGSVRAEQLAYPRVNPSDPAFLHHDPNAPFDDFAQWHLAYQSFPRAWELGRGQGGEVAVIDEGVYVQHPDLAGRVSGTLDCVGLVCAGDNVSDETGHGTHVGGLACADSDSGYGLASAGFDCSLYAIKTDLTYTTIINAIYAAADHGSDAINMSFGGGGPDAELKQALDYAWERGAIPVAAGANEPTPSASGNYPAQYIQPEGSGPNIDAGHGLVVTSAKYSGDRSAFAQSTTGISLAAFGSATDAVSGGQQGILSTWPPEVPEPSIDTEFENRNPPTPVRTSLFGDNRFAYLAGTSMAAPQVAGLVALIRAERPMFPAAKLIRLVKLTASNCGDYAGGVGWGVINADVALGAALDRDLDPPGSRVRSIRLAGRAAAAAARRGGTRAKLRLKRYDASCSQELPRAGLKSVTVFGSVDGAPYKRLRKTRRKSIMLRLKAGHRYRFYSVAVDHAGNHESAPRAPDAKLRT